MDLVTITDHDSIGGCLEYLEQHPDSKDFFISEEVSCRLRQGDVEVHLGVFGMDERLHRELQPLRRDVFEVTACLRESGVFFVLNHLLHFYRRQLPLKAYLELLNEVPGLEARNGAMSRAHNELIEDVASRWTGSSTLAVVGGSDAHTLRRVARTWTEAPDEGVGDIPGFLKSLRDCRSWPAGVHGGTAGVAGDTYGVVARYYASLLGVGPCDHGTLRRVGCLGFSLVALTAQFLPLAIVASGKRLEAREVRRTRHELSSWLDRPAEAMRRIETGA